MSGSRVSMWQRGIQLFSLLGVMALSAPTAATAQITSTDQDFLNSLYSFLQSQDDLAYQTAGYIGDETNVWLAQGMCMDFRRGLDPAEGYNLLMAAAQNQMHTVPQEMQAQASYSVGLYGGSLMNLGAAYYCPDYQPGVEAALRSL
ncbi:MAG: hypothetical protein AAFV85_13285 [Cyanobacteria bacterium J06634_6]